MLFFKSDGKMLSALLLENIAMSLTFTLPAELEIKVTEAAARRGRQPLDYVFDALNNAVQSNHGTTENLENWLDWDCIRESAAEADPSVKLEAVRNALSKIPGSMSDVIISEREERF
jgi:hypothetical protein